MNKKEIVDIDKYIFKITPAKAWVIIGLVGTLLSGAFGFGVWTTNETAQTKANKVEQVYQVNMQTEKLKYMELETKAKGFEESSIFFKRQYLIQLDRFTKCEQGLPFDMIIEKIKE